MTDRALCCTLRAAREAAGLSQSALAKQVGLSRQALIAIEAGRQVPGTHLALALACALGCRVEDLFQLPPEAGLVATLAPPLGPPQPSTRLPQRVALGRVRDRWVAHPLADGLHATTDGLVRNPGDAGAPVHVELLGPQDECARQLLMAGCAPLLGVLAQRAGRRYRDARLTWLPAHNRKALQLLAEGLVHVAGLHVADDAVLAPLLRELLPNAPLRLVHLTRWRQGLVLARGNPRGIRQPDDLLRDGIRFARREPGSGAASLTERWMASVPGAPPPRGPLAANHAEVASLVRAGAADAGIAIEAVALAADLEFVPLSEERFELVVPRDLDPEAPVDRLLEGLGERDFRSEAAALPGYDSAMCGQVQELSP